VLVSGISNAVSVSTAEVHTCALLDDGTVSCWGSNAVGEMGDGTTSATPVTTPHTVASIANAATLDAGGKHTCVRSIYGTIQCWGQYFFGQDDFDQDVFIDNPSPVAITGLSGIAVSLSSGGDHSCVILNNRSIQCWGSNDNKQLGFNNSYVVDLNPVTVMNISNALTTFANPNRVCFQQSNGKNQCWDGNIYSLATPKEGSKPQG
jgi:alpha-tubulin suppressor-like RCC1 family protein